MDKITLEFPDSINFYKCLTGDDSTPKISTYKADYTPKLLPKDDCVKIVDTIREKVPFNSISTYKSDYTIKELPERIINKRKTYHRSFYQSDDVSTTYKENYTAHTMTGGSQVKNVNSEII